MEKYLLKKGYQQLDRFMGGKDMHCHFKSIERVGGEAYIELGYGKSDNEIKELSRRGNLDLVDKNGKLKEVEAFRYITQLNAQLYPDGWSTGIYIDLEGNYEYKNLVIKLKDQRMKEKFIGLLNEATKDGYELFIDSEEGEVQFNKAEDFIDGIVKNYDSKNEFYIRVVKIFPRDIKGGIKEEVLKAVIEQFESLYHLYDFMAWNTINNNYIF